MRHVPRVARSTLLVDTNGDLSEFSPCFFPRSKTLIAICFGVDRKQPQLRTHRKDPAMLRRLSFDQIRTALLGFALIGLVCGTKSENANATTFAGEYTGSFTGGIVDPGPPVILLSSGIGTDPTAPFGLTSVSFSHSTSI